MRGGATATGAVAEAEVVWQGSDGALEQDFEEFMPDAPPRVGPPQRQHRAPRRSVHCGEGRLQLQKVHQPHQRHSRRQDQVRPREAAQPRDRPQAVDPLP